MSEALDGSDDGAPGELGGDIAEGAMMYYQREPDRNKKVEVLLRLK